MLTDEILGPPIPDARPLFATALAIHIGCGLTAVIAGALAATAKKRRGRHPRAGRIYLWALGGIFTTATIMAAIRWGEDAHLFAIAVIAFGLGLYGYQARRRHKPGWPPHHAIGMGQHRDRLLAHGQHLKRGVLLYGPPGTGKTHTVRYLVGASPGTTVVLLSGGSLRHIHAAAKIARAHQPAIVVLEDCDLVAEDRSFGTGTSPLLFEVLDALDGLDPDAYVAFVLTTNRVEDLEVALAQRPGRVDLAVQIPLPDTAGRLALLQLYGGHLFGPEALSAAAARTEGTTASFAKELVRRAVLAAALADEPPGDDHLGTALDELLSDSQRLTRSLLGVEAGGGGQPGGDWGPDADGGPVPPGPMIRHRARPASFGWFAYGPPPSPAP